MYSKTKNKKKTICATFGFTKLQVSICGEAILG